MTAHGTPWGSLWEASPRIPADTRVLMFTRGPNMLAVAQALLDLDDVRENTSALMSEVGLDSDTTPVLDALGGILQRPRNGATNDEYRTLLKIQVELILSSTANTASILRIIDLFTGNAPISYGETYPMGFVVGVQASTDKVDQLVELLRDARAAAYGATLLVAFSSEYLLVDSVSTPISGAGVVGSVTSTVTDAFPISSVRTI